MARALQSTVFTTSHLKTVWTNIYFNKTTQHAILRNRNNRFIEGKFCWTPDVCDAWGKFKGREKRVQKARRAYFGSLSAVLRIRCTFMETKADSLSTPINIQNNLTVAKLGLSVKQPNSETKLQVFATAALVLYNTYHRGNLESNLELFRLAQEEEEEINHYHYSKCVSFA